MTNKKRQISLSDILDDVTYDKPLEPTEEELDELEELVYAACLDAAYKFFSEN